MFNSRSISAICALLFASPSLAGPMVYVSDEGRTIASAALVQVGGSFQAVHFQGADAYFSYSVTASGFRTGSSETLAITFSADLLKMDGRQHQFNVTITDSGTFTGGTGESVGDSLSALWYRPGGPYTMERYGHGPLADQSAPDQFTLQVSGTALLGGPFGGFGAGGTVTETVNEIIVHRDPPPPPPTDNPEPATLALFGVGCLLIAAARRIR